MKPRLAFCCEREALDTNQIPTQHPDFITALRAGVNKKGELHQLFAEFCLAGKHALTHEMTPTVELPAVPTAAMPRINWSWIIAVAYLAGLGWFALRLFIGIWRARQLLMLAQQIAPQNQGAMPTALRGHAEKVAKTWPLRAVAMAPEGPLAPQTSIIKPGAGG